MFLPASRWDRRWFSSERYELEKGRVPVFKGWRPAEDWADAYWKLTFSWGDVVSLSIA